MPPFYSVSRTQAPPPSIGHLRASSGAQLGPWIHTNMRGTYLNTNHLVAALTKGPLTLHSRSCTRLSWPNNIDLLSTTRACGSLTVTSPQKWQQLSLLSLLQQQHYYMRSKCAKGGHGISYLWWSVAYVCTLFMCTCSRTENRAQSKLSDMSVEFFQLTTFGHSVRSSCSRCSF
jgi:hypothetical protein